MTRVMMAITAAALGGAPLPIWSIGLGLALAASRAFHRRRRLGGAEDLIGTRFETRVSQLVTFLEATAPGWTAKMTMEWIVQFGILDTPLLIEFWRLTQQQGRRSIADLSPLM